MDIELLPRTLGALGQRIERAGLVQTLRLRAGAEPARREPLFQTRRGPEGRHQTGGRLPGVRLNSGVDLFLSVKRPGGLVRIERVHDGEERLGRNAVGEPAGDQVERIADEWPELPRHSA